LPLSWNPIRRLHVYFLSSAKIAPNMDRSPHICDMLDALRSIVVSVLQYYSTVLHRIGSLLRLIWHVLAITVAQPSGLLRNLVRLRIW
jgi:hypothetical protein